MKRLKRIIRQFHDDTRGMEVSEYAVVGVVICLATMGAFLALSGAIAGFITSMANILQGLR